MNILDDTTIELIGRVLAGEGNTADWQALDQILQSNPEARQHYLAQAQTDLLLCQAPLKCESPAKRSFRIPVFWRLAAGLIVFVALLGLSYAAATLISPDVPTATDPPADDGIMLTHPSDKTLQSAPTDSPLPPSNVSDENSAPPSPLNVQLSTNTATAAQTDQGDTTMNLLQNARAYIAAAATAATALNVAAEEAHWIGMGSDDNWSNIQNWRFSADGTSPAGCDLVFGAEDRVTETKINNIVDASITIGSITYTNSNRFPSPPTGNNFQYVYHVTQINAGQTLTVDGNTTNVDAFRIGGNFGTSKHFIPAKITGPGTFTVNAPTKSFRLFVTPSAATGGTILDVTGVANFNVNVSNIWCGGSLPAHSGALLLPTGAGSQSTLCAKSVYVNGSSEEAANSRIIFGASTTLFTDFLGVNVPPPVSGLTDKGGGVGTLDFATGAAATHSLVIRGFSGEPDSRTEMRVASAMNTPDVPYFQSAHVYWTNGFVDAKFSSLIITEGRGHKWSKETGGQRTDFFFANGTIDAETIVIGRALVNNTGGALSALPAIGAFNILGGNILAGSMILGDAVPLSKGQSAVGMLKVANNASVTVSDDLVTGNRQGTGNACTSIIEVVGGTLNVAGNIAPGAFVAQTVSQITLSGGEVQVPNGELRIETGTLTLDGGQAQINTLVLTNEAAEVAVNLKQDSEPGLITATHTQLGGILTVNDATDYSTKSPLKKWTILRGPHTGTFQTLNLPERMQVLYTADSVDILYPGHATQITIF